MNDMPTITFCQVVSERYIQAMTCLSFHINAYKVIQVQVQHCYGTGYAYCYCLSFELNCSCIVSILFLTIFYILRIIYT